MDLLERYVHAVGAFLPAATREDTLAELRANLLAQLDARAEELGRRLITAETASILKLHGRPHVVASRYLPQRSLIGPELFPPYTLVLKRSLPLVILGYTIVKATEIILSPNSERIAGRLVASIFQFIPVLITFWAIATLVFAVLEYTRILARSDAASGAWDPAKLPPVRRSSNQKPFSHRLADLVATAFFTLYLLATPLYPFLVLGPGGLYFKTHPLVWSSSWHTLYGGFAALLLANLGVKALTHFGPRRSWSRSLALATKLAGVFFAVWLLVAHPHLLPGSDLDGAAKLAALNRALDIVLQLAFVISLVDLSWTYVSKVMRTQHLALQ